MLNEAEKAVIINFCKFAFDTIYNGQDPFIFDEDDDIDKNVKYLQNDTGQHWIDLINFSCNQNFKFNDAALRRFNIIEISKFLADNLHVAFSDTPHVLLKLMEMYVFKDIKMKTKIKTFLKLKFFLPKFSSEYYLDGKVILNIIRFFDKDEHIDDFLKASNKERFDFIYDYLINKGIQIFLNKDNFSDIAKSEDLMMIHILPLFSQIKNLDSFLDVHLKINEIAKLIKSLHFFEIFDLSTKKIAYIHPNSKFSNTQYEMNIKEKAITKTMTIENPTNFNQLYIFSSLNTQITCNFKMDDVEIGGIPYKVFLIDTDSESKLEISSKQLLNNFSKSFDSIHFDINFNEIQKASLPQTILLIKSPFRMASISFSNQKIDINAHKQFMLKFKPITSNISFEIVKSQKDITKELKYKGIGFLSVDMKELCDISKIEFNGDFNGNLIGKVQIFFQYSLNDNLMIYFHAPKNLKISNLLCNYKSFKLEDNTFFKEDDFFIYTLGLLTSKTSHILQFDIEIIGEINEDYIKVNFPVTKIKNKRDPEFLMKIHYNNEELFYNEFPESEYHEIILPFSFNPLVDLNCDLYETIGMFGTVFFSRQKLLPCDIIFTKLDIDLDNSSYLITKKLKFNTQFKKKIFVLIEAPYKQIDNESTALDEDNNLETFVDLLPSSKDIESNNLDNNDENNIVVLFNNSEKHVKEIIFPNDENMETHLLKKRFRAFKIRKLNPNEEFVITLKKKIEITKLDVHKFVIDLFFDHIKPDNDTRNEITFEIHLHSNVTKIQSLIFENNEINFEPVNDFSIELSSKNSSSQLILQKQPQNFDDILLSAGIGFLSINCFEICPIKRIEINGVYKRKFSGEVFIYFDNPIYENPSVFHPNSNIAISNFSIDNQTISNNDENLFVMEKLNKNHNQHFITFDIDIKLEKEEDNLVLSIPILKYKNIKNPEFFFQIYNKNNKRTITFDSLPSEDVLQIFFPYNDSLKILKELIIKQIENVIISFHYCHAIYFDKMELTPCKITSCNTTIDIINKKVKTTKIFAIHSKRPKNLYIIAHSNCKIKWNFNHDKITTINDNLWSPYDVYSIGLCYPDQSVAFTYSYKLDFISFSFKSVSFNFKIDLLKDNLLMCQQLIHMISEYNIKSIHFLKTKINGDLQKEIDLEIDNSNTENETQFIVKRAPRSFSELVQKNGLGYFAIEDFIIIKITKIYILGTFDRSTGKLKGTIHFLIEAPHNLLNGNNVFYYLPSHDDIKLHSIEVNGNLLDEHSGSKLIDNKINIGILNNYDDLNDDDYYENYYSTKRFSYLTYEADDCLIQLDDNEPLTDVNDDPKNTTYIHSKISIQFSIRSIMKGELWEFNIPTTRIEHQNPHFLLNIKNYVIKKVPPYDFFHFYIPIDNNPEDVINHDSLNEVFPSINFGYAFFISQRKIVPCIEPNPTRYEISLSKTDNISDFSIQARKYFQIFNCNLAEVFLILSKNVKILNKKEFDIFAVNSDDNFKILSLGIQSSKRILIVHSQIKTIDKNILTINKRNEKTFKIVNDLTSKGQIKFQISLFTNNFIVKTAKLHHKNDDVPPEDITNILDNSTTKTVDTTDKDKEFIMDDEFFTISLLRKH